MDEEIDVSFLHCFNIVGWVTVRNVRKLMKSDWEVSCEDNCFQFIHQLFND